MRKLTTIILLVLLSSNLLLGQDTITTYLNRENRKCSKEFAIYFRKAYPDSSGIWIAKKYHMNGQLRMIGKYSDKKLKKQVGTVILYHYNGEIAETGQYIDNKMAGIWKRYYTNGDLQSVGRKTNDKKDSIWTFYNINSNKVFGKVNHIKGKAEGESKWYYESGKICEIAIYKNDKIKSKIDYDEEGNIIKIAEKDCQAEFIGGNNNMILFLQQKLKYPEELQLQGKEGVVLFHFIVRKDGKIDDIEFQKTAEQLFNHEAVRVFSLIKNMKPARDHGRIVDQECTWPIAFRLTY